MRLATWNCQKGLDSNWGAVEALDADVLVVQEYGTGTPDQVAAQDGWTCEWQPGRWHKGLAVIARSPYLIESREPSEPFAVSTLISGPDRFRFVGFWAMSPRDVGYDYPQQATRLIAGLPDDGVPTVVAGDFNASKSEAHLANVRSLEARGLVSAYHANRHLDHSGDEPDPTSYFQWQESRPYHMDFVFVPAAWDIRSVEVGTFAEYPGRRLSDHVPVIVTVSAGENGPGS